jgi:hypothetical protein
MGRPIVKLAENEYVEWSSVVDAPVSWIMTLDELKLHVSREQGNDGLRDLPRRLERVEKFGTSLIDPHYESAEEYVRFNRAGPNESCLTMDELRRRYRNQTAYERFRFDPGRTCNLDIEEGDGPCTFPAGHSGPHSFDSRVKQ